jgi:hypothetical protein
MPVAAAVLWLVVMNEEVGTLVWPTEVWSDGACYTVTLSWICLALVIVLVDAFPALGKFCSRGRASHHYMLRRAILQYRCTSELPRLTRPVFERRCSYGSAYARL